MATLQGKHADRTWRMSAAMPGIACIQLNIKWLPLITHTVERSNVSSHVQTTPILARWCDGFTHYVQSQSKGKEKQPCKVLKRKWNSHSKSFTRCKQITMGLFWDEWRLVTTLDEWRLKPIWDKWHLAPTWDEWLLEPTWEEWPLKPSRKKNWSGCSSKLEWPIANTGQRVSNVSH